MEYKNLCNNCVYGVYNPCSGGFNCHLKFRLDYSEEDIARVCNEIVEELLKDLRYHE